MKVIPKAGRSQVLDSQQWLGQISSLCDHSYLFSTGSSSLAQSCLFTTPWTCSTPGFPVHNQLPELAQTHVYQVGDAIHPFHPLSSPSPPAFKSFPASRVFFNESILHIRWPKYWSFSFSISTSNEYSGLISFRTDRFKSVSQRRQTQSKF